MSKSINQISIFLNNRPGRLNEVLTYLTEKQVNILSLNISETTKYGIVRIIVEEPDKVYEFLKEKNYLVSLNPVFVIPVEHGFGALEELISHFSKRDINIEYMYSMAYYKKDNIAYMVLAVDDIEKTNECLETNNISTILF